MADSSYDVQSTVGPIWPVRPALPVRRDDKGSGREGAPSEPEATDADRRKRAEAPDDPGAKLHDDPADGVDGDDPTPTKGRRIDAYA